MLGELVPRLLVENDNPIRTSKHTKETIFWLRDGPKRPNAVIKIVSAIRLFAADPLHEIPVINGLAFDESGEMGSRRGAKILVLTGTNRPIVNRLF